MIVSRHRYIVTNCGPRPLFGKPNLRRARQLIESKLSKFAARGVGNHRVGRESVVFLVLEEEAYFLLPNEVAESLGVKGGEFQCPAVNVLEELLRDAFDFGGVPPDYL